MGRLFDAGQETKKADAVKQRQEEIRRRAEEADKALAEAGFLDNQADKLGAMLADARAVQTVKPIRYSEFRKPGSKWMIEHGRDGDDYVFQVFPLRPPGVAWNDVVTMMIAAMDVIFPRSLQITYAPPNDQYQVKFYTIRIKAVATVPGWEPACERALNGLAAIDAWPTAAAPR